MSNNRIPALWRLAQEIASEERLVKRLVYLGEIYEPDPERRPSEEIIRLFRIFGRRRQKQEERRKIDEAKNKNAIDYKGEVVERNGIRVSVSFLKKAYDLYAAKHKKDKIPRNQGRSNPGIMSFFHTNKDGIEFFENFSVENPTDVEVKLYHRMREESHKKAKNDPK